MKIKLTCMGCGAGVGVAPNDGVIHVNYLDMRRYADARKAWDERHPADNGWSPVDFADFPRQARWAIHCDKCNPHWNEDRSEACEGCYWFDAQRADTAGRLLNWTSHLMGKNWLKRTNWAEFIRPFGEDG